MIRILPKFNYFFLWSDTTHIKNQFRKTFLLLALSQTQINSLLKSTGKHNFLMGINLLISKSNCCVIMLCVILITFQLIHWYTDHGYLTLETFLADVHRQGIHTLMKVSVEPDPQNSTQHQILVRI